jgi:hypothetical protein
LLDGTEGTVFTLGDNAYEKGTSAEFANCYNPSWGRHKARTKPSVGNHEYGTANASGSTTSARLRGSPPRAITATMWATGTSSS